MSHQDLHRDACAVLGGWRAPTDAQELLRQRYLAHLAAFPDAMARDCRPDHLTASTLVMDRERSHVLLTLHAKANRWFQFGGHCEADDASLREAAAREALEESGVASLDFSETPIQLSAHPVEFCRTSAGELDGLVHHLDVRYLAYADRSDTPEVSEESLDVRWWPIDALPDPEPEMVELVELARG